MGTLVGPGNKELLAEPPGGLEKMPLELELLDEGGLENDSSPSLCPEYLTSPGGGSETMVLSLSSPLPSPLPDPLPVLLAVAEDRLPSSSS